MQFFEYDGVRTNQKWSDEDKNQRMIREEARRIAMKSDEFNQKLQGKECFFVIKASEDIVSIGIISADARKMEKHLDAYLKTIEIELKDTYIEEITFHSVRNKLQSADRNGYINDDEEILEQFGIRMLNVGSGRMLDFGEDLIEDCINKKDLYAGAQRFLSNETFIPELDRIYAGKARYNAIGHPVHYMIQTDDRDIREGMYRTLFQSLYANGRLRSKRYCFLDFHPGKHFSKIVYDCLYKSCSGGAIVVRYFANDDSEDEYATSGREIIEVLCEVMKKFCNQVLTVFCLPRECTKSKDIFYENLGNTSFIELKEEPVYSERATKFLKILASDSGIRTDKKLFAKIDADKSYLAPELHDLFDEWYNNKLKTSIYPQYREIVTTKCEVAKAAPKGSAYDEFKEMIGLTEAKKVITQALDYYKAQKLFAERGMKADKPAMHMVFTGNPGTAKTSVARLFARIMKDNGLLSKGNLIEVGRGDLVGKYVGWTAPTIQKKFREAQGGVLFIDEAYSLVDDRDGSFGDEAINTIVQEMENHRDDMVVIFAGYPNEMKRFLQKNPGFSSRIAFHIPFEDYNTTELCNIANLIAKKKGLILADDAQEKLVSVFEQAKTENDFGNGRYVRNIIEKAKMAQATRLLAMDYEFVSNRDIITLCADDIKVPDVKNQGVRRIGFCG